MNSIFINLMKIFVIKNIILLILLKIIVCSDIIKEKEFFQIQTNSSDYKLFSLDENKNKFDNLYIQIILCNDFESDAHISVINQDDEEIFGTDVIGSRTLFVNITDHIDNNFTINGTSSNMYVQYQYVKGNRSIILAKGVIKDYNFTEKSISFNLYPVFNNTNTTYDLYFIGKLDIYDICQKLEYVLKNTPISTVSSKAIDYFNLTFNDVNYNHGYYLLKGNNVDDVSYTYFYKGINIVKRKGPFNTVKNQFFQIKTESEEYYSLFTASENTENKKFMNIQIILCNNESKSHFSLIDENNYDIYETDIIGSKQQYINLLNSKNITIMATSPKMYFQYQYVDNDPFIFPFGQINSFDSNLNFHYLHFNMTPVVENSHSIYELYFEEKLNFTNICDKLEYTLNNTPISRLNISGINITDFNFTYDLKADTEKNVDGNAFIKSNNINETNYAYFYDSINLTVNYQETNSSSVLMYILIIVGCCLLIVTILLIVKYKDKICKKDTEDPSNKDLIPKSLT